MRKFTLLSLCLLGFLIVSCDKDKDDDKPTPQPAPRTEGFDIQVDGVSKSASTTSVQRESSGAMVIYGAADDWSAELDMTSDLSPGTYTTNETVAFAYAYGTNAFLCNSCEVKVIVHDIEAKYFKATLSGQLDPIFPQQETGALTLNSATIAVFY